MRPGGKSSPRWDCTAGTRLLCRSGEVLITRLEAVSQSVYEVPYADHLLARSRERLAKPTSEIGDGRWLRVVPAGCTHREPVLRKRLLRETRGPQLTAVVSQAHALRRLRDHGAMAAPTK